MLEKYNARLFHYFSPSAFRYADYFEMKNNTFTCYTTATKITHRAFGFFSRVDIKEIDGMKRSKASTNGLMPQRYTHYYFHYYAH